MTRMIALARCSVLLCSIVGASLPATAHHSLTAYNRSQSKTVEGVVKEFRFVNPHSRLLLLVATADGTMKEWGFEGGSVRRLQDRGVSAKTFAAGDRISVHYNPNRNGAPGGFFVGLTDADGKTYGTRP